jgi:phage shock protein C
MEIKRLYRSRSDLMLGGVCGGLAKYLNVDPAIIRLVFVLLLFLGGGGFWIYLVLWIITPVEPLPETVSIIEVEPSKEEKVVVPPTESKIKGGS